MINRNRSIALKRQRDLLHKELSPGEKKRVAASVKKTVKEYGETLRLLAKT